MNNIQYAQIYLNAMDLIYQEEALTRDVEGNDSQIMPAGYGEFKVAKVDVSGLGDFERSKGYAKGNGKFTWETIKMQKERSVELRVDRLENGEALDKAFSAMCSEFTRTKVIPEIDAARVANIFGYTGITTVGEKITTAQEIIKALRKAANYMDNEEVPAENRVLWINTNLLSLIEDMNTYESKAVLNKFSVIRPFPERRFYTDITLNDGKSTFGYVPATGAHIGNFIAFHKGAVVAKTAQFMKYFTPDQDQTADDHVMQYRNNSLFAYVFENKLNGVYGSYNTDTVSTTTENTGGSGTDGSDTNDTQEGGNS